MSDAHRQTVPELPYEPPARLLHALLEAHDYKPSTTPNPPILSIYPPTLAAVHSICPQLLPRSLELLDEVSEAASPTIFTSPAGHFVFRVKSHSVLIAGMVVEDGGRVVVGSVEEGSGCFWCGCHAWKFSGDVGLCKHVVAACLAVLEGVLLVVHIEDEEILDMLKDEEVGGRGTPR